MKLAIKIIIAALLVFCVKHAISAPAQASLTGRVERRWMTVTAYCSCKKCCGKNARGITASGLPVSANGGLFVAAPSEVPFGSYIAVPGYAKSNFVPVLDRGGSIQGDNLDVYFKNHNDAVVWGRRSCW